MSDAADLRFEGAYVWSAARTSVAYGEAFGLDPVWLTDLQRFLPPAALTILLDIAREHPESRDFVGHIGGDDFIVITTPDRMEPVAAEIVPMPFVKHAYYRG